MNIDTNIITAVIGVIGVIIGTFVGSLLSGIGHLLRSRSEAKKVINQNIFNLFQIWHLISLIEKNDIEKFSEMYIEKIKELYPNEIISGDQDADIKRFCAYISSQFLNFFLQRIDTPFKENYFTAVLELSKFSPVLAYDLSNNRYINELLNHFEEFYHCIYQQNATENSSKEETQFYNDFYKGIIASKEWTTKDFSKELQKDIIKLSWKSGIRSWISCKIKIRKRHIQFKDKTIDKDLDEYIQEVIRPLIEKSK